MDIILDEPDEPGRLAAPRGRPAVAVNMKCELSQEHPAGNVSAALIREEIRWWDDDPVPDIVETIVCEIELHPALPDLFVAVDQWLRNGHRLVVQHSSWKSGDTGAGTGVVMLMVAELRASNRDERATESSNWLAG